MVPLNKQPQIKSSKQHFRLWFEFYKLSLKEPDLKDNIEKSSDYYKPWGDVSNILFDPWWKEHKHLFGVSRVEQVSKVINHDNALNVAIPLNQPVSKSIKQLKELIEEKQKQRLEELGLEEYGRKTKSVSFGQYELTSGVEIRGRTLYEIQLMYTIWVDMGKPPVNSAYCTEVVTRLRNRPRSKWIPYLLSIEPSKDRKGNLRYTDDQLRQVRRYLKKGYKICQSVSKGQFPGRNNL